MLFTLALALGEAVARSEAEPGLRNTSHAHSLQSTGRLNHPVDQVPELYFHPCALAMSGDRLARAALFPSTGGIDPISGRSIVSAWPARRTNPIMLTCGHCDACGEFAIRVGLRGGDGSPAAASTEVPGTPPAR